MAFRDRIVELRRVSGRDLAPNPRNWRQHPDEQRRAVTAVLEQIGIADALIAFEDDDGLTLLDGHLRRNLDPDQEYPVLITDLTGEEADVFLATFDPLTDLATADQTMLESLLGSVWFDADDQLQGTLSRIGELYDIDLGFGDLIHEGDDPEIATDAIQIAVMVPKHQMNDQLRQEFQRVADKHNLRLRVSGRNE